MFDLHRHDEFSTFDGFGKAPELAKLAKAKGYTALGITNHGNINGLIQHYSACKKEGIKPILGVEAYFQPSLNNDKPRYHLCLIAKDLKGYGNINRLMDRGEKQKYYKPIITFKDLEEFNEGVICTSACIAGFIPQMLLNGNDKMAYKAAKKFKDIFGEDFYMELQPYVVDKKGTQEKINEKCIELADEFDIECILTSDSHFGSKEDFDSYLKMHEIGGSKYDIAGTYGERYMPDYDEMVERFIKMHGDKKLAKRMAKNLTKIEEQIDGDMLEKLPMVLPEFVEGHDSKDVLIRDVKKGLKERGKYNKKYIKRCKEELEIMIGHGFSDYFLIVADYVKWAKAQGIGVGPGRGSVCNCQVAWALGITEVDSLKFGLDFRRFLRKDKKKMPDIDLDFQTSRRKEVIEYIVDKYKGHAAQICSYGLYKIDNLINDLAKVCNVEDKAEIKRIKDFLKKVIVDGVFTYEEVKKSKECKYFNSNYDNIIKHFGKLYLKVRYIGTHAAGVAVTGGKLLDYCGLKIDAKTGKLFASYDLADLEQVNVIKFDILGLSTMEQIVEMREFSGETIEDSWYEDERIYEEFRKGNTDGVFQLEKSAVKDILKNIECDNFEDIVAASSMNRPGPLSLGMPQMYAENKFNAEEARKSKWYEYTKETYGTIVYQEQLQQICVNIGNMSWGDSDRVMKILKRSGEAILTGAYANVGNEKEELINMFVKGAMENGYTKKEATELFEKLLVYTFNKGHGVGYSIISLEEMYYKIYHPAVFWYAKNKYAPTDGDRAKYSIQASKAGLVLFLPHVNYSADYMLRKVDGERVIQEGLAAIKGVGDKAAQFIENERKANGIFKSEDDFIERCKKKGSPVNKGVIEKLKEHGALEFSKKIYINRVTKYNATLYMKGLS